MLKLGLIVIMVHPTQSPHACKKVFWHLLSFGLHHKSEPVYIMDLEVGPYMEDGLFSWCGLMIQIPWFDFIFLNQFTKL